MQCTRYVTMTHHHNHHTLPPPTITIITYHSTSSSRSLLRLSWSYEVTSNPDDACVAIDINSLCDGRGVCMGCAYWVCVWLPMSRFVCTHEHVCWGAHECDVRCMCLEFIYDQQKNNPQPTTLMHPHHHTKKHIPSTCPKHPPTLMHPHQTTTTIKKTYSLLGRTAPLPLRALSCSSSTRKGGYHLFSSLTH